MPRAATRDTIIYGDRHRVHGRRRAGRGRRWCWCRRSAGVHLLPCQLLQDEYTVANSGDADEAIAADRCGYVAVRDGAPRPVDDRRHPRGCEWGAIVMTITANLGQLEVLKWLRANGCP